MSFAIDRSDELLSVAQTALSILLQKQQQQQQQQEEELEDSQTKSGNTNDKLITIQPKDLTLHNPHDDGDDDDTDSKSTNRISNAAKDMLSEAVLSLLHLDNTLKTLATLVKRRGHTNDPTNDINNAMNNFQTFVKDVMEIIDVTLPQAAALPFRIEAESVSSSGQRRKHYEMAAKILKSNVEERMETFKHVMKVRGEVIKDLTLRRNRLLQPQKPKNTTLHHSNGTSGNNNITTNNSHTLGGAGGVRFKPQMTVMSPTKVKSQLNSPLFTMSSAPVLNPYATKPTYHHHDTNDNSNYNDTSNPTNGYPVHNTNHQSNHSYYKPNYTATTTTTTTATTPSTSRGYYGNGYNPTAVGYGGYNHHQARTGMRHRGTTTNSITSSVTNNTTKSYYNPYQNEDEIKVHDTATTNNASIQSQIQKRRAARQSKTRLESARMAEKTLSELTTMFSKMSNLIQSQGETLEKIEDDVEVAVGYVDDGYKEVGKLYENTKGNRGLIVKCFGILIFMVIFMKYYG